MRKVSARVIEPTIKASTFAAPEPEPIIAPPKPQPMPCGHLPAELASSDEGTSFCQGCEREANVAATLGRINLEHVRKYNPGKTDAEIRAMLDGEDDW